MRDINVMLRKTSLVDYPGKVAAVLFFQGCNLRCPWCYNWELVTTVPQGLTGLNEALAVIAKRKRLLGGVVLSGGEPTLINELPAIIAEVKQMALCVKLDTNGMQPDVLKKICADDKTRPDFIAMDIKLPPERYAELTGQKNQTPEQIQAIADKIRASVDLIRDSGVVHEFRSLTLPSHYLSQNDIDIMRSVTVEPLKFRAFWGGNCLDESWNHYNSSS
jgi:pyruvate formate lyase activating enzyme